MRIPFDRIIGIIGIILAIIFWMLPLNTSSSLQKYLIITSVLIFILSITLLIWGTIIKNNFRKYFISIKIKRSAKLMKKVGIIQKTINYILISKDNINTIRYGYSSFQDTIIPLFFDYVHRRALYRYGLKIDFVQVPWNGHCRAFEEKIIDVSLGNFSSLLPYYSSFMIDDLKEANEIRESAPSTFFPFFEFKGHGVFIKTSVLDKIKNTARKDEIKGLVVIHKY